MRKRYWFMQFVLILGLQCSVWQGVHAEHVFLFICFIYKMSNISFFVPHIGWCNYHQEHCQFSCCYYTSQWVKLMSASLTRIPSRSRWWVRSHHAPHVDLIFLKRRSGTSSLIDVHCAIMLWGKLHSIAVVQIGLSRFCINCSESHI